MLAEKRRAYAGSLSGGQQQMLAIGQSLMAKPRLLMLDEPSAGLSPAIVKEVLRTVAALAADGMGILIVEQLVEDVMAISHDVVVIDEGRVAVSGPVDTVATDRQADGCLPRPAVLGSGAGLYTSAGAGGKCRARATSPDSSFHCLQAEGAPRWGQRRTGQPGPAGEAAARFR